MAKPFLKFVGGKTQLLPELLQFVPEAFGDYYEPFVGGGAMFFALEAAGKINKSAFLGDTCEPLIDAYQDVQGVPDKLIASLQSYKKLHSKEFYYATRKQVREGKWNTSRFIYFNKTGFNGLYRVNRKGQFNVPMGSYVNPKICDPQALRAASKALAKASFFLGDFKVCVQDAAAGDLVYFDPPYCPVNPSSFVSYGTPPFSMSDHVRLLDCAEDLAARGVHVIMSNSSVDFVWDYVDQSSRLLAQQVEADRLINRKSSGRRKSAWEVIIYSDGIPNESETITAK